MLHLNLSDELKSTIWEHHSLFFLRTCNNSWFWLKNYGLWEVFCRSWSILIGQFLGHTNVLNEYSWHLIPIPSESFPVSLVHRLPPHTFLLLYNKCLCMTSSPSLQIFWSLDFWPRYLMMTCLHTILRKLLLQNTFTVQCVFLQAKLCILPWPCPTDKLMDHSLLSTHDIHQLCFEMHI